MQQRSYRPGTLDVQVNGIQIEDLYMQHEAYKRQNAELECTIAKLRDQLCNQGAIISKLRSKLASCDIKENI